MNPVSLQKSVAEKIKALYAISRELEQLFPGRHYTPDGHMVGSIGEALAASWYGLELFTAGAETHDAKAPDGRLVQIKATQIDRVALSSEPEWLLVLKIHPDGTFTEEWPRRTGLGPLRKNAEERPAAYLAGRAPQAAGGSPDGPAAAAIRLNGSVRPTGKFSLLNEYIPIKRKWRARQSFIPYKKSPFISER